MLQKRLQTNTNESENHYNYGSEKVAIIPSWIRKGFLEEVFSELHFFKIILFIYFLERGREGEREGEKHQCVVASHMLPTLETWPTTQACALDWKSNQQPFDS